MQDHTKHFFNKQYLPNIFDKIRFWFLLRKIKRQKIIAVWEAYIDKMYYLDKHGEQLAYSDTADRAELVSLRKGGSTPEVEAKIIEIEQRISLAKAIKQAYEKNENFIEEVNHYIESLSQWQNRN